MLGGSARTVKWNSRFPGCKVGLDVVQGLGLGSSTGNCVGARSVVSGDAEAE
jgi:hypothetical protein